MFCTGQRVEAFTSPLWTALPTVVAMATPFSLTGTAVNPGIILTIAGLALAVCSSVQLARRTSPDGFLALLGALVFVAVPAVWSLASLGFETSLTFHWLGACLAIIVRWAGDAGPDVPAWSLIILGFGLLVRPELGIDSLVLIGMLLVVDRTGRTWPDVAGRGRTWPDVAGRGRTWPDVAGRGRTWPGQVRIPACAAAVPMAYQVFRLGCDGLVVANTAIAKVASLPRGRP